MPVLHYTDGKNKFKVQGGCLAVMGRSESATMNIDALLSKHSFDGLKEIRFDNILQINPSEDNKKYLSLMDKYMSMFPFMRCVKSSNLDILTTTHCDFDVENYTQNEVMHAMFHIRMLAYASVSVVYKGEFMIEAMYQLMEKDKLPFWKAYIIATIPHGKDFRFEIGGVDYLTGNDANTWRLASVHVDSFTSLLRGEKPVPLYKGGTVSENANRCKKYVQNISDYLRTVVSGNEKTMADFIKDMHHIAVKESRGKAQILKDAFGFVIAEPNSGTYKVNKAHILSALDKTIKKFKISKRGMIC